MNESAFVSATDAQRNYQPVPGCLNDQVIMISGATGGLGQVLTRACAAAGATVVLLGRELALLESLYDELETLQAPQPAILPLNQHTATDAEYLQVADTLHHEFGRIDALVHTAADLGTLTPQPLIDQLTWNRTLQVNLNSARLLCLACQPLLLKSGLGSVVFTLDRKTRAYWGGYGVSKAALAALCVMLADETDGRSGADDHPVLAYNGIDPGPMRTRLRRRAFPGELEHESEPVETRASVFMSLITRQERALTGQLIACSPGPEADGH